MIYLRYLVLVCVYCCATHIVLGILVWLSSSCIPNKGNNKITELRTILQRESPNS